jgi:hypothetical protein
VWWVTSTADAVVLSAATATVYEIPDYLGRDPVAPEAGALLSGDRVGARMR